jgi:predicted transcriptional regulator
MIASLGGYAFHSFATGVGGVVQGTAHASAGDVARGSFNAGQVNYRNVSAGTTSLGSFSGWTTSFFTTTGLQENVGNITRRGNYMQVSGGSLGDVKGLVFQAFANGDRAGGMALQFAFRALGADAKLVNLEADAKRGILSFTAVGKDGTTISYKPGEGGEGVLYMTIDGKTLATAVRKDGSIEGITAGNISNLLAARYGESVVQSWAQELAQAQKDAELLSQLTQEADRISTAQELTKFYEKVKRALGERRTEMAREVLQRIADVIREYLQKDRTVTGGSQTGTTEIQAVQTGSSVSGGYQASLGGGVVNSGGGGGSKITGGISGSFHGGVNYHARETTGVRSENTSYGRIEKTTRKGEEKAKSTEEAASQSSRESSSQAYSDSISVGTSYSVKHGSIQELMQAVSKTLQFSKERLESYRQSLQAAQSVGFEKSLFPAVFNQLKQEEAQKLQNSGLSKEEIEARAAMNALARLNNMIEKDPKELFKYLNSVSGLPDAEKLKEKVEENTPQEGTVGNPPPEMKQQIENAENKLKGEYSLNAFVGNKKQAGALAKKLTQLTGRQAEVIKTGKGYMVSVGGFNSEDLAKGLAQGLGLKNYQVVKVQPQQQSQPQQQQPPTPAKR